MKDEFNEEDRGPLPVVDEQTGIHELKRLREWTLAQMAIVQANSDRIKGHIDTAKARVIDGGQYAKADWWRRVNDAKRHAGRRHQGLQFLLGQINRLLKKRQHSEHEADRSRQFMAVAKELLPPETYAAIWDRIRSGSGET